MTDATLKLLHEYYDDLLSDYKDVISSQEVVKLTGYAKSTITNWCGKGRLKHFIKNNTYYIPKVFLIEFFCSPYFRSISARLLGIFRRSMSSTTLCRKNRANNRF